MGNRMMGGAGPRRASWRHRIAWLACLAAACVPAVASADRTAGKEEAALARVRQLVVSSPYRMSAQARRGIIEYRLDGGSGVADWAWPETGEQHVQRVEGPVVLTICRDCGREPPPSVQTLADATRATAWLQAGDPRILGLARVAQRGSVDARMRRLAEAVRVRLSAGIAYDGFLDARAAYDARRGDCTEYAVLLAAVARARGIPTRVVAGLAYASRFIGTPHVFGPHMWVQAWDGQRWTSYDAALGQFDAGHIALVVGDGDPQGMRGALDLVRRLRIADAAAIEPAVAR